MGEGFAEEASQLDAVVRSSGVIWIPVLVLCVGLLLGCSSSGDAPKTAAERHPPTESRSSSDAGGGNPLPPDAGTATGHGADRTRVEVPERDASPPRATIALSDADGGRTLAEASRPGSRDSGEVELTEPRLRGTAVGEDVNGGIVRVRVSISERISCQPDDDGPCPRLRARYFPLVVPPHQVDSWTERSRSARPRFIPFDVAFRFLVRAGTSPCGRRSITSTRMAP